MTYNRFKKSQYINGKDVDQKKLDQAIQRIANIYLDYKDPFVTLEQTAELIRISGLYRDVSTSAVGRRLSQLNVEWKFRNEKRYFRIPSVIEDRKTKLEIIEIAKKGIFHENQ